MEMTNEEKASQLVSGYGNCCKEECYYIAMRMAEWKDQQFKEYLEKKREQFYYQPKDLIGEWEKKHKLEVLNEIINEFFKE